MPRRETRLIIDDKHTGRGKSAFAGGGETESEYNAYEMRAKLLQQFGTRLRHALINQASPFLRLSDSAHAMLHAITYFCKMF